MNRCPDCGRVISLHFPVHVCEPTEAWRKAHPNVVWVIQHKNGTYLGRRGGKTATHFKSAQAAQEAYDAHGLGRLNESCIKRVTLSTKRGARAGRR